MSRETVERQTEERQTVEVVRPGALTTVQDAGRPASPTSASRLPGRSTPMPTPWPTAWSATPKRRPCSSPPSTASACVLTPPSVIAVTGARATVLVDGRPEVWSLPVYIPAGSLVEVGPAEQGVRSYLAVAGGFEVPPTLGSKATDLLSGLGPPALVSGQRLAVGPAQGPPPAIDFAPYRMPPADLVLPLHPGPRHQLVNRAPVSRTCSTDLPGVPEQQSHRVAPLGGAAESPRRPGAAGAEGIVWGSVELLNSRGVLVFLADHPTTGGYPVIAIVDRSAASDCAPGPTRRLLSPSGEPGEPTSPVGDGPVRPRALCAGWTEGSLWRLANRYRSAGPALPMALA